MLGYKLPRVSISRFVAFSIEKYELLKTTKNCNATPKGNVAHFPDGCNFETFGLWTYLCVCVCVCVCMCVCVCVVVICIKEHFYGVSSKSEDHLGTSLKGG